MNTKLTLKLNKTIIEKAKTFARENKVSLSTLVENYFESLTKTEHKKELNISPTVKALSGVLKLKDDSELGIIRDQYLVEKYLDE